MTAAPWEIWRDAGGRVEILVCAGRRVEHRTAAPRTAAAAVVTCIPIKHKHACVSSCSCSCCMNEVWPSTASYCHWSAGHQIAIVIKTITCMWLLIFVTNLVSMQASVVTKLCMQPASGSTQSCIDAVNRPQQYDATFNHWITWAFVWCINFAQNLLFFCIYTAKQTEQKNQEHHACIDHSDYKKIISIVCTEVNRKTSLMIWRIWSWCAHA